MFGRGPLKPGRSTPARRGKLNLVFVVLSLMLIFVSHSPSQLDSTPAPAVDRWSVGYWAPGGPIPLPISQIDWGALTHVIHFAATVNADGSLDLSAADVPNKGPDLIEAAHAAGVKVLLAVANPYGQNRNLQAAVLNRAYLESNIMRLVDTYHYDGVDLDWEPLNPAMNGPAMTALAMDLRTYLGDRILTAAVSGGDYQYWKSAHTFFDRISVMTYDMAGTFNPYSWYNAALYGSDPLNRVWSIELARQRMTSAGVPAAKLNIGIPFYGWISTGGGQTAPRQSWGSILPSLSQISYNRLVASYDVSHASWDADAQVPWLAIPNGWVTFDNERSVTAKVDYVKRQNLGGWIVWVMNQGYLPNQTPSQPLLHAIKIAMQADQADQ
jgi:chitinase